jgi:RNA 3'-terminal phosphate cyclase (ATP)
VIEIDGSMGEGGGQVLRTSLALSLLTSSPLRIRQIRAGRAKPGLMRQHLLAVQAAAAISRAEVSGDTLGSHELTFRPGAIRGGQHRFATSGAGSTTLVLQTVLLPLVLGAKEASSLTFEGGTHNPMAPPFDFVELALAPLLARMGVKLELSLKRHGFYPAGGGEWLATVFPAERLEHLELLERGAIRAQSATALLASLPMTVALRELDALCGALGWERQWGRPRVASESRGPGNALFAVVQSEHVTEVVTGFGERGVPAEQIAAGVAAETARYLAASVPVGEHLADQLLLPMALGHGGVLRTVAPSLHTTTQLELLRLFIGTESSLIEEAPDVWRIEIAGR